MRSVRVGVCLFGFALGAFAQGQLGSITGTIADPAGAVVPNAAIEAKNVATGAVYQVGSSGTGNYTIPVPTGTYELTVTVQGFKKFVRENLVVPVGTDVRQDATLEVGATTEAVTVTEAAPLLQTESGDVSHTTTTNLMDDLPILTLGARGVTVAGSLGNIRNPLASVELLPGAYFATDNTLRINGMPSSSQAINIEGQDATNGMWKQLTQGTQVGQDAIEEVTVQTSNNAAEYGGAGGGYFNYAMKSGTNQFHGSAYDYFDNEALNAGLPFTDAGTLNPAKEGQHIRNPLRQNDYGFTLGGPVWIPKIYNGHNKTFFFFSFEQFRQSQGVSTGINSVPTLAERQGNFSGALTGVCLGKDPLGRPVCQNAIYDPNTTQVLSNGQTVRNQFPNNTIPQNRMDPTALYIQNLLPAPRGPNANALVNNYAVPTYSNFRHTTTPSIKIDHSLSDKIKLSGYFSEISTVSPSNNGFTQVFTNALPQDMTSYTTRINWDQTITPTLLLHLGAGLLYTNAPAIPQAFNQSQLGWGGNYYAAQFPSIGGLSTFGQGGNNIGLGSGFGVVYLKDEKPTFNSSLTWVKGNHTFKLGGSLITEGFPQLNTSRANGEYGFSGVETSIGPAQNGQPYANFAGSGFPYASFQLGAVDNLTLSQVTDSRLGNHQLGIYIQDSWKATHKLTIDYGLRWDYANLLQEQYGRMQDAAFNTPNPVVGGLPGSVIYGATCHCNFNNTYPFSIGPHLGVAYQITPKTVFRGGASLSYAPSPENAFLSYSVPDFYSYNAPSYGTPLQYSLHQGNPFAAGNPYGNAPITWPNFAPHYPSQVAPGVIPPQSPFISVDRNAGRMPRIFQWSIGLQREVAPNLLVEAAYVGNRGVWWSAPLLDIPNYNELTPQGLLANRSYGATTGLNVSNAADAALLNTPISSSSVVARYPLLANPNNVYAGFPGGQTLGQALRPHPQWDGVPPFLGPPLGDTWYDSLQAKVTKRYSHGLSVQGAFTWQKELDNGANSDTSYLTPNPPLINDVNNYGLDKQISGFERPFMLTVSALYTTPALPRNDGAFKALSWVARDWTVSALLLYQSGALIQSPPSNNNLLSNLQIGPANNPALWGGGTTFYNRVLGQPLLLQNPNSGNFDPTQQLGLNPKAWTDAPLGTYGTSAPYYNDYRWQRQPQESMSFGRIFQITERTQFHIRAEFQNIFNRLFFSPPSDGCGFGGCTSPASVTNRFNPNGELSSGYGFANFVNGAGALPRSGQIVAQFTF